MIKANFLKSNTSSNFANSRKTLYGLGLAGSRWAPVAPTAEQIAKAEAPETILKANADLMAVRMVMDTQQELVDKRKREALENGGEGLRYVSDYRKIQEENEQKVAEIAKEIIAASLGAAHSRSASEQSQSIFYQRASTPTDAPAKAASTINESAQVESPHSIPSDASVKAISSAKESAQVQAPLSVASNASVKSTASDKDSAQIQTSSIVGETVQDQSTPSTLGNASVKPAQDKESAPVQAPTQAASDAGKSDKATVQSPVKCAPSISEAEKAVSSSKAPAKPAVGLATNFTQWNS